MHREHSGKPLPSLPPSAFSQKVCTCNDKSAKACCDSRQVRTRARSCAIDKQDTHSSGQELTAQGRDEQKGEYIPWLLGGGGIFLTFSRDNGGAKKNVSQLEWKYVGEELGEQGSRQTDRKEPYH